MDVAVQGLQTEKDSLHLAADENKSSE